MTEHRHSQAFMLWITLIIAMLSMLAPFSIDAYMPSFPDIAADLAATPLQMQQTMSFYMVGFAIMNLFYGSLADAYGRRRIILTALLGYALMSLAVALVDDIEHMLWLRVGQGVFAAAGVVVGRALVRDLFDGAAAQRVMSAAMFWFSLAPALAPVIGGWLHSLFGWRSVFWFLMLLSLSLFLLVAMRLGETLPREARTSMHPAYLLKKYFEVSHHRRFMLVSLSAASFFGGFFLYITSAPTMIYEHLGLGPNDFGYLFAMLVAGIMVGSRLSVYMSGIWSRRRQTAIGFVLMVSAALLNLLLTHWLEPELVTTMLPITLYAIGMALLMPIFTLMGLDCFPGNRGLASSMSGFLQMGTNAMIAGVVTPLLYHSLAGLALGMLGFVLAALLLYYLSRQAHEPEPAA